MKKTTKHGSPGSRSANDTIVISRRLAIYRNLSSAVFPERAPPEEAKAVGGKIAAACEDYLREIGGGPLVRIAHGEPGWSERLAVYTHLHDGDPERTKYDSVVFLEGRGLPDIIVNSSDHVEISFEHVNNDFGEAAAEAGKIADELGKRLNFANCDPFGWLSADPDHAGAGMRISQSFCFGALLILRELDAVLRGVERIGFDVVPVFGDTSPEAMHNELAPGACYRISPLPNDGMDGPALATKAERVFRALVEIEKNARLALNADFISRELLTDYVMRAIGIGAGARLTSETEYIDVNVALAFGVDMGVIREARPPEERKNLGAFFRDSVALFAVQTIMAQKTSLDEDDSDFTRKCFLANMTRHDFRRYVPEWLEHTGDKFLERFDSRMYETKSEAKKKKR